MRIGQRLVRRWNRDKERERERKIAALTPEFCRQKLLGYADSFEELSRTFCENGEQADRRGDADGRHQRWYLLEEQRTLESRQVMGDNFQVIARIMKHIAEEMTACRPVEDKQKRMLTQALRTAGISMENLYYLDKEDAEGRCAIGMTMYTDKKGGIPADDVAELLSGLLRKPVRLSVTSPYLVEQNSRSFEFVEEAAYVALTGYARATKEDEMVSGDHYAVVESEKGRVILLLSDGAGSGEEAGKSSGRALDLMEKMLEAGYDTKSAVHMINAAFFAMGEESSHPTLDVCELNLYQGSCGICKVGGAATFLKRGETVELLARESLPLGIFQTVEAEWMHRELRSGDSLIMVTDGVLDALGGGQCGNALLEAIRGLSEQNPAGIAEKLLQTALCANGGHIRDDMTILAACVWDNGRFVLSD